MYGIIMLFLSYIYILFYFIFLDDYVIMILFYIPVGIDSLHLMYFFQFI